MQINNLSVGKKKSRKRVGRGGKRGTYSGRGIKGQKSRSGVSIDPLFEGGRSSLVERLKKNKGFRSPRPKKIAITLEKISHYFSDGETVSINELIKKGLINKMGSRGGVKIINSGKLESKVKFSKEIGMSESVEKMISKK